MEPVGPRIIPWDRVYGLEFGFEFRDKVIEELLNFRLSRGAKYTRRGEIHVSLQCINSKFPGLLRSSPDWATRFLFLNEALGLR